MVFVYVYHRICFPFRVLAQEFRSLMYLDRVRVSAITRPPFFEVPPLFILQACL